jgi:hypothetical protein
VILLHEAIRAAIVNALRGLYIGMPGQVESYDAASGKAAIKPLIQEPDASGTLQSLKPISGVPVVMPGGAAAALYLPVAVGDTGWISFSHRSIEVWLTRGGDAPPGDPRVMDMTDAVFWPGLRPFSAGSLAEEADAAVLRNGAAKLKLRAGKVALGNDAGELLDLMDQFLSLFDVAGNPTGAAICAAPGSPLVFADPLINPVTIRQKLNLVKGVL